MKSLGALLLLLVVLSCSNTEQDKFVDELNDSNGGLPLESLLDTSDSQNRLNREEITETIFSNKVSEIEYESKVILDSMVTQQYLSNEGCNLFFNMMFKNKEIKRQIITDQLERKQISYLNREFLMTILRDFDEADYLELSANKGLLPVFKVRNDKLGIIDSRLFLNERNYDKFNIPHEIIEDNRTIEIGDNWEMKTNNRSILRLLDDHVVYLVTNHRVVESKIIDFHDYEDECLQYSNFVLDFESKNHEEHIYFATNEEVDLNFGDFEKENQRVSNFLDEEACFDCPTNLKEVKVICNLRKTDLYFGTNMVAAKELTNSLDFILFYIEDDLVIPIDVESIDLFGCSCL